MEKAKQTNEKDEFGDFFIIRPVQSVWEIFAAEC